MPKLRSPFLIACGSHGVEKGLMIREGFGLWWAKSILGCPDALKEQQLENIVKLFRNHFLTSGGPPSLDFLDSWCLVKTTEWKYSAENWGTFRELLAKKFKFCALFRSVSTTFDSDTSAAILPCQCWCLPTKSWCVPHSHFQPARGPPFLQKHRDRNGSCFALLFRSIGA